MGLWDRLLGNDGASILTDTGFTAMAAAQDPFKLPTVVAGRQLIADIVSSFPMEARRGSERLEPTPAILKRPNPSEPSGDTFEKIVNALTRYGHAWIRVTALGADGWPIALEVVDNRRVTYTLSAEQDRITEISVDARPQDMRLMRGIPFILEAGSPIGKTPLREINDALLQLNEALAFSATYYSATASTPPYAIISPTRLQEDKAAELLDAWTKARDNSRPAVISGNLELKTFQPQSAADALVQTAIDYLDAVVARVLQLPPSMLATQSLSSLTYSNTRDEYRRFLVTLGASYLRRIEAVFTELLPRGTDARFDTSSLTRLDEREQLDYDIDGIAAGLFTVDEVRERRGLPANADTRII